MSDQERRQRLAQLLATPVHADASADENTGGGPRVLAFWVAGLVIGGAIVLLAYAVADPDSAPTAVTTTVTTLAPTTTAAPTTTISPFPDGYTPIDSTMAVRAEAMTRVSGQTLLTFTSAVRDGLDPTLTSSLGGGEFTMVLRNGETLDSTAFISDPFQTGVFTVAFDDDGLGPGDIEAVTLTERWFTLPLFPETELPADVLPYASEGPIDQEVSDGVDLILERVELTREGGAIDWRLEGGSGAVDAHVELTIGFNDRTPFISNTVGAGSGIIAEEPTERGSITLTPSGIDQDDIFSATVVWSISLITRSTVSATIPIELPPSGS